MEKCKPRLLKGFRDVFTQEYLARRWMIETISKVYERYGFIPIETPSVEYVDVLGKYLPECDKAQEGIFSFRDSDQSLVALRYDLTAPLARVVAQYKEIPRPLRRYQLGIVWRNEKPGLGRFREFYQLDMDIVGIASMQADSEVCCIICDSMESLNILPGEYLVKVNNRKILNGILEKAGIPPVAEDGSFTDRALITLRAIDKLDRMGMKGVIELLGKGRRDESGDFTQGADLSPSQIQALESYLSIKGDRKTVCNDLWELVKGSSMGEEGVKELQEMDQFFTFAGYPQEKICFDPTIVRGLSYYTGPVFETVLTIPYKDEKGNERDFGSVFSGGRYDGLVARFLGEKVPATGASIGLDRLLEAIKCYGKLKTPKATTQVLITTMDKTLSQEYHKMAFALRKAGINTEVYLGKGPLPKQLKYADYWDIPIAILLGGDEFQNNQVTIKDLRKGRILSQEIQDREEWRKGQPAQITISRDNLLGCVQEMLQQKN